MSVRMRPRKEDEVFPFWYDNTKLVAVNTCPTWGVVRYGLGRTPSSSGTRRTLPLEAGSALHQVFAAIRIADMIEHGKGFYDANLFSLDTINTFAAGEFGGERWDDALRYLQREGDFRQRIIDYCLAILESSGFTDDPSDRRRTLANMEESIMVYVDRYEWGRWMPIWYQSPKGTLIGVEVPFDLVVEATEELGEDRVENVTQLRPKTARRFIGRIDGLVLDRRYGTVAVHENKSASRLDDAWHGQWQTANQVTGYCLAAETLLNNSVAVNDVTIFGLALPLPRTYDFGGCVRVPVTRSAQQRAEWFSWFSHTADTFEQFLPQPTNAPHYTHSCSRYFRPCSLLAFCSMPHYERQAALDEMTVDEWNPLTDTTD